jgi:hypothetical protein
VAAFSKIYSDSPEQEEESSPSPSKLKILLLVRKGACLKVQPKRVQLLKRITLLKRSQTLCVSAIGKMFVGNLRNL